MLPADAKATDLIEDLITKSSWQSRGGQPVRPPFCDVLSCWLECNVEGWFAGADDKHVLWEVRVPAEYGDALQARVKRITFAAIDAYGRKVYRILRDREPFESEGT
jgi:flavin reductase (DIM6/NTAB) family NADH-FMN oxidoreductase RutF